MIRLILLIILLAALAFGASWLADQPGAVSVIWRGHEYITTVPVLAALIGAVIVAAFIVWWILSLLLNSPGMMASGARRRRRDKGFHALTRGLVAIGTGDTPTVRRAQAVAAQLLPDEPLTRLLSAQAAQSVGDHDGAVLAFRDMVENPQTRLLGLRGLYMEARKAGDVRAAYTFAEEAVAEAPRLGWATEAVIAARCGAADYAGARDVLERQMSQKGIDKAQYRRRRAVLLAAEALGLEAGDPLRAREKAVEAAKLAPDLVPAAACAARLLAAAGELRKASRIIEAAYAANPHPDLADVAARLRPGDGAVDRLKRLRGLANKAPSSRESAIALARGAIDAQEFTQARLVLEPLLVDPSQRICLLMAELEAAEHSDIGKAREWTARALRAARDPAWIADGIVSDRWEPVSPVTGKLDAFVWAVPPGVSATPILEHEAERVKAAIAAVHEREEARAAELADASAQAAAASVPTPTVVEAVEPEPVEPEPAVAAAPVAPAPAAAIPAAPAAAAPPEAAPAPVTPADGAAIADAPKRPLTAPGRRPDPIVAQPPLPDDPGPEAEPEPEPETGRKRFFGF